MARGRLLARLALALWIALTAVLAGDTLGAPPVGATISIAVAPAVLELTSKPGATGHQTITVSNRGDQAFDVTTGVTLLTGAGAGDSAVSWLQVKPPQFHLEAKQEKAITVSISVPPGLQSGGYYAAVTVATGKTPIQANGAGIAGQVDVPILFTVNGRGDLVRRASLKEFAPVLEADGRVGFRGLVHNDGNVHFVAQGKVEIADANGKRYGSLDLPPSRTILPGTDGVVRTQGSVPLQSGATYTATVNISPGENIPPLHATATFTMGPPVLAVTKLDVCENLDRGPTLSVNLHNTGPLGLEPGVTLAVRQANGGEVGETSLPPSLIWPKDATEFHVDFPQRLVSGQYVFVVTAHLGTAPPVTQTLPFQIGGSGGTPAPLCSARTAPATPPAG